LAVSEYIYGPPIDGKPFKLAMGLRALKPQEWLEGGDDLRTQLLERNILIDQKREIIYAKVPGFDTQIQYFLEKILKNLQEHHAASYEISGQRVLHRDSGIFVDLDTEDPLLELARVIAEDLCLLQKINGEWVLVAGVVIFPSRWKLSEKIGTSLDQIHSPVPGYEMALQPHMSATFEKIRSDRGVWRKNWSLHPTHDLHQPESIHSSVDPDQYWWRTERQTLTRSAADQSILFTIRNRVEPLRWIMSRPAEAEAFAQTLQSMSPDTLQYKGLTANHQEIVHALRMST